MPRRLLVLVFAFLLFGMRHEAQWHTLAHIGDWFEGPHEQSLLLPHDDGPCAICALFTGGAAAAPNDRADPPVVAVSRATAAWRDLPSPTAAAPSFYLSRAPPALL